MYFDSFSEFLEMGRHGFYVWTAYGLSLALVVGQLIAMVRRRARVRADIRRALRREQLTQNNPEEEQSL